MNELIQNYLTGGTAVKIAQGIEDAVRDGVVQSGERLPTVRRLAERLDVSPGTVAAAFATLKSRGVVVAQGRRGTRISHRPLASPRSSPVAQPGTRNLYDGNPDRELLLPMDEVLSAVDPSPCLYGEGPFHTGLLRLVSRELRTAGVAVGEFAVVYGAIDAIGRVLTEHLRPGDRVAVEDPGFTGHLDLVTSRGLALVPVRVDEEGPVPESLERACAEGAGAMILTPRAQSPTGAALTESRARALRRVLRTAPDLVVIEDDHANRIMDVPLHCLHDRRRSRWAHIHSFSKSINPDLRMAVMTGDDETMRRIQDRMFVEERWVSIFLQRIVHALISHASVRKHLRGAARTYTRRRTALLNLLEEAGVKATGCSGYNVWVPVAEEISTVQALAAAGWSVSAGERFRVASPPGIRITASTLDPAGAKQVATAVAAVVQQRRRASNA